MAQAIDNPILFACGAGRTNGVFTAEVKWKLQIWISSNPLDMLPTAAAAAHAANLPFEGNTYPGVPLASCRGVKCDLTEDNGVYVFTANYSDENATDEEKGTDDNPLLDLPVVKPVAGMTTRAITRDFDRNAILNTANDPILQSMDDNTIGFRISANVPAVPSWILDFRNTRNASAITVDGLTMDAGMARFILPSDWKSDRKNRNDIWYYVFTFELMIDERDQHNGYPLNAGFQELTFDDDFNYIPIAITRPDGSEPSEPVPLDEDGYVLKDPTPETVLYRETQKYGDADYSVLPGIS